MAIRRLGPGDAHVLALLSREDAAFDLADRGGPRPELDTAASDAYLADPRVLHWVAEESGTVVGHLLCHVQRRRAGAAEEVLLYEIGVRDTHRRRGIGRALVATLETWMRNERIGDVWVLADNDAVPFYVACGFTPDDDQPTQLSRTV